jgi:hypothetical protein
MANQKVVHPDHLLKLRPMRVVEFRGSEGAIRTGLLVVVLVVVLGLLGQVAVEMETDRPLLTVQLGRSMLERLAFGP